MKTSFQRATSLVFGLWVATAFPGTALADRPSSASHDWDTTVARGNGRVIDFETSEGTWISVDVSPDRKWIAFDLLGHIYRKELNRKAAHALTQDSGIALNFHPSISPDGRQIAFISDRGGQNGLWVMDADGSSPRLVFQDDGTRLAEPAWLPDGKHIVAVRAFPTPGRGWHRQNTRIWLFSTEPGEKPRELIGDNLAQYNGPSPSPDGSRIYFHTSYFSGNRYGTQVGHHIQSIPIAGGPAVDVIGNRPVSDASQPAAGGVASDNPSADIQPKPSPDGRWLAFARRMPETTEQIEGHTLAGSTALWVKDLATGQEHMLHAPITRDLSSAHAMYSYRVIPSFDWTSDSREILISVGGKIRRIDVQSKLSRDVPFTAHVHRQISAQARGHVPTAEASLSNWFAQWPATSPDGQTLAFVAGGKVWASATGANEARLLAPEVSGLQLTPAWSAGGDAVVFSTWDSVARGGIWIKSGEKPPRRIALPPGEYIFPSFSPDGQSIVAMRGTAGADELQKWSSATPWEVVLIPLVGGAVRVVSTVPAPRPAYFLANGTIAFERQENAAAAAQLYSPFPPAEAFDAKISVVALRPDSNAQPQPLVTFPARNTQAFGAGNNPVISPDGQWVAFESAREIFVAPVRPGQAGEAPRVDPNPNKLSPDVRRVSDAGGVYPRWRSSKLLEFVSGRKHVVCDVTSFACNQRTLQASMPRDIPAGTVAFVDARIVSLGSSGVIERGTLVVEGNRIRCIGTCDLRSTDKVIDAKGKTIIPGFVDVHVHDTTVPAGIVPTHVPELGLQLAYGVTTIVDPASDAKSILPMADLVETGYLTGPRVYGVGDLVTSGLALGFGDHVEIRTLEDAERIACRNAEWGAVALKAFRLTSRRQMQQLAEGARRCGLSITAEGGPIEFDIAMAMDGQTGWEHYIANLPIYKDVSTFLGRAGIVYSPTSGVSGHPRGGVDYYRSRHDFSSDRKYRSLATPNLLPQEGAALEPADPSHFSFPVIASGLAAIRAAGGRGAIGEHSEQSGIGSHWEIWSYATRMPPLEALKVASLEGAYFHGLDHEIGSLEVGKLADLVVLNSNPLEDIRNTADIELVVKGGNVYRGADLERIWPSGRSYLPAPWSTSMTAQGRDSHPPE